MEKFTKDTITHENLIKLLNGKEIYSRFSGKPVQFVDELTQEHYGRDDGVFSDGMFLLDNYDPCEDDIQQMVCILKNNHSQTLEDFYEQNKAYDDGVFFFNAIARKIKDKQ